MVERSLSMREVPGSIPGASKIFSHIFLMQQWQKSFASSGNRTRAARVAGEHSTTEPPAHTPQSTLPTHTPTPLTLRARAPPSPRTHACAFGDANASATGLLLPRRAPDTASNYLFNALAATPPAMCRRQTPPWLTHSRHTDRPLVLLPS